jgi:enamine deaminase RidA (YjgF/YER057c/UK114 family)
MTQIDIYNPDGIRLPAGTYSHVARVSGVETLVTVAGQVGISPEGILADGIEAQCEQVFRNVAIALEAAGANWSNVIQTMTFLTDRDDLPAYREWREREFQRIFADGRYPPSTLLIVGGLASEEMRIEIQVTAAV